jgi:hypothetical protein
MTHEELDALWNKSVNISITAGDGLARYRYAEYVAAAEREACAKVCEEKTAYQMQIPCPDGIPGCLVFHAIEAKREKTGSECAAAIRARGK